MNPHKQNQFKIVVMDVDTDTPAFHSRDVMPGDVLKMVNQEKVADLWEGFVQQLKSIHQTAFLRQNEDRSLYFEEYLKLLRLRKLESKTTPPIKDPYSYYIITKMRYFYSLNYCLYHWSNLRRGPQITPVFSSFSM